MPTIVVQDKAVIKSAIFTATIVKLYHSKGKSWLYQDILGAVVIARDIKSNIPFFKIVDLKVVWEHEIYPEIDYVQDRPYFHSFSGDVSISSTVFQEFMIGFLFAEEVEAIQFYHIFKKKVDPIIKPSTAPISAAHSQSTPNLAYASPSPKIEKKKKKKKISKADISGPTDFRHVGHVGFDPVNGFNIQNIPAEWKKVFEKAGVTKEQLEDEQTAQFIFDFVQKKGGIKAAKTEVQVNSSTEELQKSREPPAVPSRRAPPPVPPSRRRNNDMPQVDQRPQTNFVPPPPPMPNNSLVPPAPPVIPMASKEEIAPSPPKPKSNNVPVIPDARAELLNSIRSAGLNSLKKAQPVESPPPSTDDEDLMASLLAKALANRNRHMAHSDSEDESDEDSEW
ncbi:hypothetical protein ROZALSC1DRAFT_31138 [Rozella allomycis CSF55]|uniref:PAK-box/P21-Rho-binding domain-containing protein n=1 Tax=Rozella allomycis (strain CSF55) TaxID=988480 RepID=A0A075AUD6_ROZAC|nr:PAK-box/P21-Rho-binding domain-containing protein [Rozella allomycis CSF55]RKP17021.1 hypothetical protein ROZALSC1DRAFT_31138 [Rozella allomycis CSF55]|eukprot:EPZ33916.1 PAK-box/P21-Rho-binding domain-containing protein [Rozella allomycis CSF55]